MSLNPRSPRAKPRWLMAIGAVAGMSLLVGTLSAVLATDMAGYMIDGSVPDAGTFAFDDPEGNTQELGPVNSNTTKLGVIHTAATPMLATTNPNAQVDLRGVWIDADVDEHGESWLYIAWERDSNKGSGVLMYEFQQDPEPADCDYDLPQADLIADCNPWENRQPGDFILVWDQAGNTINIILRTFGFNDTNPVNGQWDGPIAEPLFLDAGMSLTAGGDAVAAVSADKFKGEAAVNLSQTIFPPTATSCLTIGNIIPGTVTGNSDTADYKDTVLADFADYVSISNCGSVKITKVTDPADGTGTFGYTLERDSGDPIRFPDDGGATEATGTLTEDGDNETVTDLIAGTDYVLSEQIGAGTPYDLVSIVCDGEDVTAGETFSVAAGDTTECTITNELQDGTLTLTKTVTNDDNGDAVETDFQASMNGTDVDWGEKVTFSAGTSVTASETTLPGYTATAWGGDCAADGTVTIEAGVDKTCTITNDDVAPTLTLIKNVIKDDGGDADPDDFLLTIGGNAATSGVAYEVDANTPYAINETLLSGYTFVDITGDAECPAVLGGTVTLDEGEDVTCTITNDDVAATLIVRKLVINDNGGTAVATDFDFQVNGGSAVDFLQDPNDPDPLRGENTLSVDAGTYTVTEPAVAGYSTTYEDCSGIEIANGETATCTITNDDQKASPDGTTVQHWVLHDTMTITGIRVESPDPAATVTFRLYSDDECSNQIGEDETVPISLNGTTGTAATATGFTVYESGWYYWRAFYSGDQFNNPDDTDCGDEVTQILAKDAHGTPDRDDFNGV